MKDNDHSPQPVLNLISFVHALLQRNLLKPTCSVCMCVGLNVCPSAFAKFHGKFLLKWYFVRYFSTNLDSLIHWLEVRTESVLMKCTIKDMCYNSVVRLYFDNFRKDIVYTLANQHRSNDQLHINLCRKTPILIMQDRYIWNAIWYTKIPFLPKLIKYEFVSNSLHIYLILLWHITP